MELHAYTRTISDLFSVKKKYIVPRFQREYSWTKEQVLELWNDIISNISSKDNDLEHTEYFIGSLVLVGDDKSISLQIVDGQQRLTTITILLSALCERFLELKKDKIAKSIYDNYIAGKDDEGEDYFKLQNETPKPFFQTTIQDINKEENDPSSQEEKCLLSSYNELYLSTSIENLKENFRGLEDDAEYEKLLKAIRDQVVKYLKVIFITVNDEDEAYTIFETLNARGMNLSFVDLIKNKVFKSLTHKHPDDSAKTKWKQLRTTIVSREGTGSLETFVRHWWISRYAYVSANNVYKSFKNKWNSGELEAINFLDEIISDANLYIKIASPVVEDFKQQEEKDLYRSLSALRIFNVIQQRPFILSIFRAKERGLIKLSELKEMISFIEKFHFLFNAVCSMRPSGIEGSYSKAARQMFEAKDKHTAKKIIGELKNQLTSRLPDKDTFTNKFSKLKFVKGYTKHKKLIQYIFSYIELSKQTTSEFQPDSITLEHILSQSEGNKDYIGSIGNLLPLGSELNEKAGNKKLTDKLKIYDQSKFAMTREFASKGVKDWGKQEIQSRTSELAEYCYDHIWKIG
ncbi:DUF262 domain-containing protein [Coleofasciculus sp.]|uniref:DUF262 domain-containing protein n=1 Tax=Coleofasciculus sp. TaxID=3100458 RepID=UPI003A1EBE7D